MDIHGGQALNLDWLYEVRNGRAFCRDVAQAAVAGEYSHCQILNPIGNSKTLLVYRLLPAKSVTGSITFRRYDTALTTSATAGVNLKVGGATATAEIRQQTAVGALGTGICSPYLLANTSTPVFPDWLCELSAGKGVLFNNNTANELLAAVFFWVER
jgi:hypothetical protein